MSMGIPDSLSTDFPSPDDDIDSQSVNITARVWSYWIPEVVVEISCSWCHCGSVVTGVCCCCEVLSSMRSMMVGCINEGCIDLTIAKPWKALSPSRYTNVLFHTVQ